VPILDGSAKNFIEKIISAGIKISDSPIKIIKINKKIEFTEGERFISIKPSTLSLDIDFQLKYSNELISNQRNKVKVYEDDLSDIYNSRTFCLFEDIEFIKKKGLAKGGSLDNAVVVKDNEVLNPEGLRNSKEFVNHKILDCIGDLYTSGYRILASITCSQGGHYLTNQLLRKVFQNKDNFSIIEIKEKNLPHTLINKNLLRSIA
jgi:UDP-3-O-[3-hydroxymyristoyl] N-acetylglucosamine deacetylase